MQSPILHFAFRTILYICVCNGESDMAPVRSANLFANITHVSRAIENSRSFDWNIGIESTFMILGSLGVVLCCYWCSLRFVIGCMYVWLIVEYNMYFFFWKKNVFFVVTHIYEKNFMISSCIYVTFTFFYDISKFEIPCLIWVVYLTFRKI